MLKRSGGLGRHEAGPSRIKHRARHHGPPGNRHVWCGLDFADADLVFDDRPAPAGSDDGEPPDYTPRFCWSGMW